ncbi:MAG: acyl-CoA dehydrogenase [Acidimicrobiia bacterium]|nr:acyl-CoA dehydrogenase [Acidimicrobiia bacterium]
MDFAPLELSADTHAFWDEVRAFYSEHLTEEMLEKEHREGNGFIPSLQLAMGARGWVFPGFPVEEGGAGLDPLRASLVEYEMHRRVGPLLPLFGPIHLVAATVRVFGSDELKAHVLPGVARGEVLMAFGYTEPDAGSDAAAVKTRAVRDGSEWVITGQKMFTTGAQLCQYSMVTARTDPDAPKHRGLTMFLVPLDAEGVEVRGIETLGGERTNFVFYDGVRISDMYRLGDVGAGWQVASSSFAVEHHMPNGTGGLEPIVPRLNEFGWYGVLGALVDAAVEWAHAPRSDGSRPIDEPRVRDRLAEAALDRELMSVTPGPYVRVSTSAALIRDAADLLDMVGPTGVLPRGEEGAPVGGTLEWIHRFAQGTSIYGGTTDIQRNLIAEQLLGLPRHRGVLDRRS